MKKISAQSVLAANCRRLRGDLSQIDIVSRAARAGYRIDQKTVSRAENPAASNSTLKTIEAVAAALGVPAWKLLMPENVATLPTPAAASKVARVVEVADGLNDDGLTALVAQAEFLGATTKYLKPNGKQQRS